VTDPAVDLSGILKRFDEVTAVDQLDLQIRDGEFFTQARSQVETSRMAKDRWPPSPSRGREQPEGGWKSLTARS
jgi:hypothetical protein